MSQVEKYEVPGSPLTMAILKTALENMFAAIGDCNRGASAPSNPSEGMLWWDTSGTPTELLKRFTAVAGWVTLFSVNVTSGIVTPYRAGSPLGTMAAEAATDYIAKSLFNAQTILAAVDDNAPGPVSVAQNRIIGRRTGNIAALTLTDVLDMIGSAAEGDILYRGADGWVRLGKGSAGQGLRMNSYANAPEWGALDESALSLSDVTTGNVSTSKHGFVPKAPNDTGKFLRGDGTWAAGGINLVKFTSSGSWTCPTGVTKIWVSGAGGGGGGGKASGNYGGGGGGGGAKVDRAALTVAPGTTYTITIGDGGDGGAGGTTSFGSLLSLPGGSKGENGYEGAPNSYSGAGGAAGDGNQAGTSGVSRCGGTGGGVGGGAGSRTSGGAGSANTGGGGGGGGSGGTAGAGGSGYLIIEY